MKIKMMDLITNLWILQSEFNRFFSDLVSLVDRSHLFLLKLAGKELWPTHFQAKFTREKKVSPLEERKILGANHVIFVSMVPNDLKFGGKTKIFLQILLSGIFHQNLHVLNCTFTLTILLIQV